MDPRGIATVGSIWVLCAIMAGIAAGEKNRRFWVWFFFGLLTGPYALYRAIKAHEVVPPELAQICPNCQKPFRKTARSCPRCGHIVVREPDRVMKAAQQAGAAFVLFRRATNMANERVKAELKTERAKRDARKQTAAQQGNTSTEKNG